MPPIAVLPVPHLRRALTLAFALALVAGAADARKPPRSAAEPDIGDLGDESLAQRFKIPLSEVGYLVVDAKTGKVLEQRQPAAGFIPASTIKVASTVTALEVLGADHRFDTDLVATGVIRDDTLFGDLFLKGGGDPVLTTDDFEKMAQQLKAKGVAKVAGRFVYDSSAYVSVKAIDGDYEESAAYNPGIAALSVNFNVLQLKWEREGKNKIDLRFVAETDHNLLDVDYLKARLARPGTTGPYGLSYQVEDGTPTWLILPSRRRKGEIRVPVKQPAFSAAHLFAKAAEKHGIKLPAPVAGTAPDSAYLLVRQTSKPLTDIVHRTLRYSNNMAAEMLGLATARKLTGKALDPAGAAAVILDWLKHKVTGADLSTFVLHNNSGLTRGTRISPAQMVAILRYAQTLEFGKQGYADLLRRFYVGKIASDSEDDASEGARSDRHGSDRPQRGNGVNIMAKTGTVNYSRGVVGYLHTTKGHDVIFAVYISDFKEREVMETLGKPWKTPPVRWWLSRSREFQRYIVKRWAERL
jgi:D-alanyl-D-alanine carboxypeptidase/D-alanyl-D-alanine-endopeptidase (penicillin-binding protein 4)